ncbi:hypothetical protein [Aquamicrobium sp. LC103]|uniref:hypothetical protein n=1 Tax=Aquamicrobium sp. LC103 TaxID=1120658 RepID=UPI00063ECE01|nr:hypothetical protein [Aquamicrobium sp. LC103]TKT78316.1 hypothetical protein XW59_011885 [Aquamicrobium sp. LC103]
MTHLARSIMIPLAAVLALGSFPDALAFELPSDMPARNGGLWILDQTSTISDGKTTFAIQKIWNACLDTKADLALHELEMREQEASVASLDEACEEPRPTISSNILSWTMQCSGPSKTENKTRKTEVQHTTTFVSSDETRAETVIVNRGNIAESHGRFLARMKRFGKCEGGLKPGEMTLVHWRVNGEETLKARQSRNIYEEIENRKAFTASRLAR